MKLTLPGKIILTGEHSVLRGAKALLLPLRKDESVWYYENLNTEWQVKYSGRFFREVELVFPGLMQIALATIGKKQSDLFGKLDLTHHIRIGVGLGTSAIMCVGIAKLFVSMHWLKKSEVFHFAKSLENHFHGQSSGADIAVVSEARPIIFENENIIPLEMNWKPHLRISYTHERMTTREAVERVSSVIEKESQRMSELDERMKQASDLAIQSLKEKDSESGLENLKIAISKACECFYSWGLVTETMKTQMKALYKKGALACKPTGSGAGGYILSLWDKDQHSDNLEAFL